MIQLFHKFLLILLATLQLLAPLVHAHTSSHNFSQGLHIPGLEVYSQANNVATGQQVNSQDVAPDTDGLLVMVDVGIKNPHDYPVNFGQNIIALVPSTILPSVGLTACNCNISIHNHILIYRERFSSGCPRAPPIQVSFA